MINYTSWLANSVLKEHVPMGTSVTDFLWKGGCTYRPKLKQIKEESFIHIICTSTFTNVPRQGLTSPLGTIMYNETSKKGTIWEQYKSHFVPC